MLLKILPGIGIAVIMGLAFCLMPTSRPAPRSARLENGASRHFAETAGNERFARPASALGTKSAGSPEPQAVAGMRPVPKTRATSTFSVVSGNEQRHAETFASNQPAPPAETFAGSEEPPYWRSNGMPRTISAANASSGGVASDNALASVGNCPSPNNLCPDPPDKGIYVWGGLLHDKSEQKQRSGYATAYDMDSTLFTLGFKKDWSLATTLGLSVDLLDGQVKSKHAEDSFKNNLSGYIFNSHIATTIGKYNIDGKLFYGATELDGAGMANGRMRREGKHKGNLYGFSGKIGIPLVFGDDIKLAPDLGIEYRKVKVKAYDYFEDGIADSAGKVAAESLAIPLRVGLKKDFQLCYGLLTPRVTVGVIKELKDTASGAWTYGAYAASTASQGIADVREKTLFQIGGGVDLATNGGWNLTLDYNRYIGKKYTDDSFRLELGKCF